MALSNVFCLHSTGRRVLLNSHHDLGSNTFFPFIVPKTTRTSMLPTPS